MTVLLLHAQGTRQQALAMQLSQTAYLSLQLPYVYFGLGRLPNFVDEIAMSTPPCLLPASLCMHDGKSALFAYG